jgi:hypothetical protein
MGKSISTSNTSTTYKEYIVEPAVNAIDLEGQIARLVDKIAALPLDSPSIFVDLEAPNYRQ